MPEISGAAMFASGEISSSATASIPPPMAVVISVWKSWDFQAGGVATLIVGRIIHHSPPNVNFFFAFFWGGMEVNGGGMTTVMTTGGRRGTGIVSQARRLGTTI